MSKLRIGVVLPISRMFPRLDRDFLAGLQGSLETSGAEHELFVEPAGVAADPRTVPEKCQRLLLQHRPHAVVGIFGSAMLRYVQPLFDDARVPLIVNNLGAEPLLHGGSRSPYVFHNSYNLWQSTYALGWWAARTLGRRAALATGFHESGYGIVPAFWTGFCEAGGGEIVRTEVTHRNASDEDPSEALQRLADAKPDFVAALYAGRSALSFAEAYGAMGLTATVPLVASAFLTHRQWLSQMGDAVLGLRTAFSWNRNPGADEDLRFRGACSAADWSDPDAFALLGYESGLMLADAAARLNGELSGETLRAALAETVVASPRGETRFDEVTGEILTMDYLLELQRGGDGQPRPRTVGQLALPERYAADYSAYSAQDARTGWNNAYMVT